MNRRLPRMLALFIVLSFAAPLLSGCWDQVEIEDRALVLGLSIDKIPAEDVSQKDQVTHIDRKSVV